MSRRRTAALLTSLARRLRPGVPGAPSASASAAGFVVSEAQFNQMFPNRNSALFWSDANPYGTFRLDMSKRLHLGTASAVPRPRTLTAADRSSTQMR